MGKEPFHWVVFDLLLLKCSAGTEALFADLGHFTYGSIQVNNIFVLLLCDYLRVCWISINLEGFY
jgi:K+ transporter